MLKYKYADFLKSEIKWREFLNQRTKNDKVDAETVNLEDSLVTLEPFEDTPSYEKDDDLFKAFSTPSDFNFDAQNGDDNLVNFSELKTPQIDEPINFEDTLNSDIDDYRATNFANIREELEKELQELDKIKSLQDASSDLQLDNDLNDYSIGFNDIEPETYGMGGRAA